MAEPSGNLNIPDEYQFSHGEDPFKLAKPEVPHLNELSGALCEGDSELIKIVRDRIARSIEEELSGLRDRRLSAKNNTQPTPTSRSQADISIEQFVEQMMLDFDKIDEMDDLESTLFTKIVDEWKNEIVNLNIRRDKIACYLGQEYVNLLAELNIELLSHRIAKLLKDMEKLSFYSKTRSLEYKIAQTEIEYLQKMINLRLNLIASLKKMISFYLTNIKYKNTDDGSNLDQFIAGFEAEYLFASSVTTGVGYPVYHSTPEEDTEYKVDYFVGEEYLSEAGGHKIFACQVKRLRIFKEFRQDPVIVLSGKDNILNFFDDYISFLETTDVIPINKSRREFIEKFERLRQKALTMINYCVTMNTREHDNGNVLVPIYTIFSSEIKRDQTGAIIGLPPDSINSIYETFGGDDE